MKPQVRDFIYVVAQMFVFATFVSQALNLDGQPTITLLLLGGAFYVFMGLVNRHTIDGMLVTMGKTNVLLGNHVELLKAAKEALNMDSLEPLRAYWRD